MAPWRDLLIVSSVQGPMVTAVKCALVKNPSYPHLPIHTIPRNPHKPEPPHNNIIQNEINPSPKCRGPPWPVCEPPLRALWGDLLIGQCILECLHAKRVCEGAFYSGVASSKALVV